MRIVLYILWGPTRPFRARLHSPLNSGNRLGLPALQIRQLGRHLWHGAGDLQKRPNSSVPGELRLVSQFSRSAPDGRVFSRNRFSWGLFSRTKYDLREPIAVQTVTLQMNLHAGVSLNKIHRYILDLPAEPAEANCLYLDRETLVAMIQKIRADITITSITTSRRFVRCGMLGPIPVARRRPRLARRSSLDLAVSRTRWSTVRVSIRFSINTGWAAWL